MNFVSLISYAQKGDLTDASVACVREAVDLCADWVAEVLWFKTAGKR